MYGHHEDCDTLAYDGGLCTCELLGDDYAGEDAAGLVAMEDYAGPDLDW